MKVERVSYDVITPSAARGILEAILWKPALRWVIERIEVLAPIAFESVRRNEVGAKIPFRNVTEAMEKNVGRLGLYIEDERQQRAGLILRKTDYVIHARFELTAQAGPGDNAAKFAEMFRRRVEAGQCHHMPCFGCREFPAYFEPAGESCAPIDESRDLGWMLYDFDFSNPENPAPRFFRARLEAGVVRVPAPDSTEIRG